MLNTSFTVSKTKDGTLIATFNTGAVCRVYNMFDVQVYPYKNADGYMEYNSFGRIYLPGGVFIYEVDSANYIYRLKSYVYPIPKCYLTERKPRNKLRPVRIKNKSVIFRN